MRICRLLVDSLGNMFKKKKIAETEVPAIMKIISYC